MTLEQLRKALAEKVKGLDTLKTKAFADGATKEDTDALQKELDEIKALEAQIKLAEEAEETIKRNSRPVNDPIPGAEPTAKDAPKETAQKVGLVMAGMIKSFRETGQKGAKATLAGIRELGHERLADELATEQRALNSVNGASGGVVIGENFAPDIIPLLYPMSSFMAGGPIELPMPGGNYRQAGGASGATASYRGEGSAIATSQPTFRDIRMTAHLLSGMVPITNQLISYSLGAAERFARNDLAMAMSTKMDTVAYLGLGINDDPLGILNLPGVYSTAATNSTTPTAANVDGDARKLINRFVRYPVLLAGLEWRMSVRTLGYLQDMRDGNGNYLYPTLQGPNKTWKDYPVRVAGNFPENLGGGTNETYLALVSFGHTIVGNAKGLELAISDQATVNSINMFETDSTAIRATMEHDFTQRYVEATAFLSAVKWGA
jgi:HK97 family phage major capsid protein